MGEDCKMERNRGRNPSVGIFVLLLLCLTAAAENVQWKFDVGEDNHSPVSGWIRLGRRTVYDEKKGFGWVKEWGIPWINNSDSGVGKDGINAARTGTDGNFLCKVPDGVYQVTVVLGMCKPSEGRTGQCVEINGRVVLPPPGVGGWGKQVERTLPAVVTDGMLKIRFFTTEFKASDRTCVSAIRIVGVPEAQREGVARKFEMSPPAGNKKSTPQEVKFRGHVLKVFHRVANEPLPAEAGTHPFFFVRNFSGDMLDDTVPRKGEYPARLSGFSARGEINGFFAALHAPRKVTVKRIFPSDLKSTAGVIPAERMELFTLTCTYRSEYDRNCLIGRKTAELLEKNFPVDLDEGRTLPCYFTVSVPPDAPAGVYRGLLRAETSAGTVSAPIELTVSSIALKAADKDFILSSDSDRWRGMTEGEIERELVDMARHGVNGLTLRMAPGGGILHEDASGNVSSADFDRLEPMLRRVAGLGLFHKILLSGTNMVLWGLRSLVVFTQGRWKQHDGLLEIFHGDEALNSEVRTAYWIAAFPQRRYRLNISYKMPAGSARAEIHLFDCFRKSVGKPFRFNLPRTGEFATRLVEFETAYPTAQFRFHLYFSGKGNLGIKELGMMEKFCPT